MTTTINVSTSLPVTALKVPKRRRNGWKRVPMDGDNSFTPVGLSAMAIPLFGSYAAERSVTVDRDVAVIIALRFPETRWVVNRVGAHEYVRSAAAQAGNAANQSGECPTTTLARFVMGAEPGERVVYHSGDHLDLRRCNLQLIEAPNRRKAF